MGFFDKIIVHFQANAMTPGHVREHKELLKGLRKVRNYELALINKQNIIFNLFGVSRPSDAQKVKATVYLCAVGTALLERSGVDESKHGNNLFGIGRTITEPLSVQAGDIVNNPDQLKRLIIFLPQNSQITASTKINGVAAYLAMYQLVREDVMRDLPRTNRGDFGITGVAALMVINGIFGEDKGGEKLFEVVAELNSFTKEVQKLPRFTM